MSAARFLSPTKARRRHRRAAESIRRRREADALLIASVLWPVSDRARGALCRVEAIMTNLARPWPAPRLNKSMSTCAPIVHVAVNKIDGGVASILEVSLAAEAYPERDGVKHR